MPGTVLLGDLSGTVSVADHGGTTKAGSDPNPYIGSETMVGTRPMSQHAQQSDATVEQVNEAACPTVEAIDQIGSKWRLLVLYDLREADEKRFNEIKRSTQANSRTLSRVLDDLADASLVTRRVEDQPIATYYSLTQKGEALCPVLSDLEDWATEWING